MSEPGAEQSPLPPTSPVGDAEASAVAGIDRDAEAVPEADDALDERETNRLYGAFVIGLMVLLLVCVLLVLAADRA